MSTSNLRDRLAQQLTGTVYDGDDPAGAQEAACFNLAVTHRPALVVAATSAEDVAASVRFAAEHGLRVTVQATGHGAAAPAEGTVLVSTRQLQELTVDPEARTAKVGAGVRWRQVIEAATPHGLAPLCGSSSGVGVVGYTLGGGMGHLGRLHGFAADHVRSAQLVTADGGIRTVDVGSDPELFWAVRGGQGGLGIVTEIEFELMPVPLYYGGTVIHVGPAIPDVVRAWARWAPTLPVEASTSIALLRLPDLEHVPAPLRGRVSVAVRFGFAGHGEVGEALVAPMRGFGDAVLDSVGPMSFAAVDGIHLDPPEPVPAATRGMLLRDFSGDAVDRLLEVAGPGVDLPLAVAEVRLMGGALERPAQVPNAVAGRDGAFALTFIAPAPPPLADVAPRVTAGLVAAFQPWATGSSLANFAGHGAEPETIWSPAELERLGRLKADLDPANLFTASYRPLTPAPA